MTRRTKIVATIGPASDSPEVLEELMIAGLDVVRLNLSHGDIDHHLVTLGRVRDAAERTGRPVAVLADLPGPKIRAGSFGDDDVLIESASEVAAGPGRRSERRRRRSTCRIRRCSTTCIAGAKVQLGDGAISMTVSEVTDDAARARVETGGRTSGQPGVHLSSTVVRLTTPTEEDLVFAETMAAAGVEFIAVSFVCTAADVERVARRRRVTGAPRLQDRDPGRARRPRRDHRRCPMRSWSPVAISASTARSKTFRISRSGSSGTASPPASR